MTLISWLGGRPHNDRSWTESFAQLVGTILSLWDASALDIAGQDGEVAPTFINLADASIKMVGPLKLDIEESTDHEHRSKHYLRDLRKSNLFRTS